MSGIIKLIFCHLIGDYVLQIDMIANTKASNTYHMFVHCVLYCVPFAYVYGIDIRLYILFVSHFVIDVLKGRELITYTEDQGLHYLVAMMFYLS